MNEVNEFLNTLNIPSEEPIIVAVSYGPDSMFLLSLLNERHGNVICAHVHHNHRIESDVEKEKLEGYCKNNGIKFEYMKIKGYSNDRFTEAEARSIRYNYFESLIKKYDAKYLFTAHHGDDLIETILMRLVRGSSFQGYSGIKLISKRNGYSIIRPLLFLTKDYILEECEKNKIPFMLDESNNSNDYTRNRYRINVIPFLKKENANVHLKFLQFSNLLQGYDDYISRLAREKYNNYSFNGTLLLDSLLKQEKIIIKKVVEMWLYDYYKDEIERITSKNVNDVLNIINTSKPNLSIDFPLNKKIIKSYNKLYIRDCHYDKNYRIEFNDKITLPNGYVVIKEERLNNTSNYTTALDSKELSFPLYFRSKKDGDKIEVLGMNGNKKVKDIFIDEKINKDIRNTFPILVDSNDNIIWLPGLKKSKYDKSKCGKYDIILRCYREENNETTK